MSFLDNTRRPNGLGGRVMVSMMNLGHRALADWGLQFLRVPADARILDCGCGGGANIRTLLKRCPQGIVKGVDASPVSVEKSRRLNQAAIREERCVIWQGGVEQLIFAGGWFDAATAVETVYFWPGLPQCFREVYRVLKPGGTFLICNECGGCNARDERWPEKISGMTLYKASELKAYLEQAGFQNIQIHQNEKGWLCLAAQK